MSFTLMLKPTVTGGTPTTLTSNGFANGKGIYVFPTSSHLTPARIEISAKGPVSTPTNPGVARSVSKLTRGTRVVSEGCCDAVEGYAIADLTMRWSLSQPEQVIDDLIDDLRAYVQSDAFVSTIKSGLLPN